jgi:hypothetical protein
MNHKVANDYLSKFNCIVSPLALADRLHLPLLSLQLLLGAFQLRRRLARLGLQLATLSFSLALRRTRCLFVESRGLIGSTITMAYGNDSYR